LITDFTNEGAPTIFFFYNSYDREGETREKGKAAFETRQGMIERVEFNFGKGSGKLGDEGEIRA